MCNADAEAPTKRMGSAKECFQEAKTLFELHADQPGCVSKAKDLCEMALAANSKHARAIQVKQRSYVMYPLHTRSTRARYEPGMCCLPGCGGVGLVLWCRFGATQLLGMIAWREKRLPEAEELLRKAIALKVGPIQLLYLGFQCFMRPTISRLCSLKMAMSRHAWPSCEIVLEPRRTR